MQQEEKSEKRPATQPDEYFGAGTQGVLRAHKVWGLVNPLVSMTITTHGPINIMQSLSCQHPG